MSSISDLKFDDKNFNKHTEYGMSLLEKSLRENGAGRSILLDKDNNIIAGNGIVEAAGSVGLEKVKIVETSGDEIIAVKRTDIAIDSEQGRTMALADNATASADLEWNDGLIASESDKWGINPDDWGEQHIIFIDFSMSQYDPNKLQFGIIYDGGSDEDASGGSHMGGRAV